MHINNNKKNKNIHKNNNDKKTRLNSRARAWVYFKWSLTLKNKYNYHSYLGILNSVSRIEIFFLEGLNVGTVPTFIMPNVRTILMFKMHNVGNVPTSKMHNIRTVPTFKMPNIGTPMLNDFLSV